MDGRMARLEKTDWLDFALAELAEKGHETLKAQTLAAGLGVTRGSFYWHFEDLVAFKRDLIAHWTDRTTQELVRAVVREGEAEAQLIGMMTRAFRSGAATERAVRAWAVSDDHVAELVAAVDWRRVRFAEQLLESLGVPQGAVGPRARMLYWAAVGRLMMARPSERGLSDAEIRDLAAIMRSGADRSNHTDVYSSIHQ
jgi:AcrR family transcriptional regulator